MTGHVSEIVGLIGGIFVLVAIIVGIPVFLFTTFKTKDDDSGGSGDGGLVEELRGQLDEIRRELRNEKLARADENDRHQRQIAELQKQVNDLTVAAEVLRDRLNFRPPYDGTY